MERRRSPLHIFPAEIWVEIVKKLSPVDVMAFGDTCPEFRAVVIPLRTKLLFPLVAEVLFTQYGLSLSKSRRVSRGWKSAFDAVCGRFPGVDLERNEGFPVASVAYAFRSTSQVGRFMETMGSRPYPQRNPFCVTRLVAFDDGRTPDKAMYWTLVSDLLDAFGSYILDCSMICREGLPTQFCRFFARMPNLKRIRLQGRSRADGAGWMMVNTRWEPFTLDHVLQAYIDLPRGPAASGMLQALGPRLVRLKVVCDGNRADELYRFPNLQRLDYFNVQLAIPGSLRDATWPLVDIGLDTRVWKEVGGRSQRITVRKLFSWLDRFGDSLQRLALDLVGVTDGGVGDEIKVDTCTQSPLHLPLLKKVWLTATGVLVNTLDFLEELDNLELFYLSMDSFRFDDIIANEDEKIEFGRGGPGKMHESNLWSILGRLQDATFESRDEVHRYRRRAGISLVVGGAEKLEND